MSRNPEIEQYTLFQTQLITSHETTYVQQKLFDMPSDPFIEAKKAFSLSMDMLDEARKRVDDIYYRDDRERGMTYVGRLAHDAAAVPSFSEKHDLIDEQLKVAHFAGIIGGFVIGRSGQNLDEIEGDIR